MIWVFTLEFEGEPMIASGSGSLLNFHMGIGFPCRGANATHGRATHYDVYVATLYEVLDLFFQIIAFLGIVLVVMVEAIIMSAVPVLGSRP
ncbi:hypothetical protein B296_00012019 [Ensete ventricosum]|uniref:Uncharacterized protein n=1 Tax=Ensete ventricosum TaxID=4639 RepID=A0A427API4_ENSVE|nr:hypothetical protein B296_00012019 [Ensete ventricosum]